ncbi:MAG: hypothetical protein WCA46_14605 [Actinocatenispora sp.]
MTMSCPHCGWPDNQPYQVLSRHGTLGGPVVWTRCYCGSSQMRVLDGACSTVIARGRPDCRDLA